MTTTNCSTCQKSKATLSCGICTCSICKNCARFVDEEMLAYLQRVPPELMHSAYCNTCFEEKVEPIRSNYDEILTRARDVSVYFKAQSKETRVFRRKEKPLKVENCADREEAIMRLAFLAAQAGFQLIIDVDLSSKKIITHGYQTSSWAGVGIPIKV